eukprot:6176742-Pleurochrysis_carterae.AAC.1
MSASSRTAGTVSASTSMQRCSRALGSAGVRARLRGGPRQACARARGLSHRVDRGARSCDDGADARRTLCRARARANSHERKQSQTHNSVANAKRYTPPPKSWSALSSRRPFAVAALASPVRRLLRCSGDTCVDAGARMQPASCCSVSAETGASALQSQNAATGRRIIQPDSPNSTERP